MAAREPLLTLSTREGLAERRSSEGVESIALMRARLQAMTWASQAKDSALRDLQRRLNAALVEAEQCKIREAALQRRAETAELAEEALASQIAELEAESFTHITESHKLLAAYQRAATTSAPMESGNVEPITPSQLALRVGELHSRLQAAVEEAAAWAQRCKELEEVVEEGRSREAALERRAEKAEEVEEALASEMAELEAEAFTHITESDNLSTAAFKVEGEKSLLEQPTETRQMATETFENSHMGRQVAELQKQLAEAKGELEAVDAKLRHSEERRLWLEVRLAEQQKGEEKKKLRQQEVTVKRKQGVEGPDTQLLSFSLHDLAGFVNLKLWNPSSLTL